MSIDDATNSHEFASEQVIGYFNRRNLKGLIGIFEIGDKYKENLIHGSYVHKRGTVKVEAIRDGIDFSEFKSHVERTVAEALEKIRSSGPKGYEFAGLVSYEVVDNPAKNRIGVEIRPRMSPLERNPSRFDGDELSSARIKATKKFLESYFVALSLSVSRASAYNGF